MASVLWTFRRLSPVWVVLGLVLHPAVAGGAVDGTPMPAYTGDPLYVKDVPDRYESVVQTIKELERGSPQTYFVVVVKSSGSGEHATRDYADKLYETWRDQAKAKGLELDPDRSVIVVAALDNRQVAVHPGALLQKRFDLKGATIDADIVKPAFIPLARSGDYPEAISALLIATNNFLAGRDSETKLIEVANAAQPAKVLVPQDRDATIARAPDATPVTAVPAPEPIPLTTAPDLAWSLIGSFLAIGLMIIGLVWLGRRRARSDFNSKLKTYRAKAVDMMDRLDALKSRLKALPIEDTDFTEPMTGETLDLHQKAQADLGKLWDRWLEVMDVVDQAQKHAALGSKKLAEAVQLVSDSKVFDEVEAGAKACSGVLDRLNHAHEEARAAVLAVVALRKEASARVEDVDKAGLPTIPYQSAIDRIAALEKQAGEILTPDPLGAKAILDEALSDSKTLKERAGGVIARLEDGKQVRDAIQKLRADVADHRGQGLKLVEEGGDPDHLIAQADQTLALLQTALEAGDPGAAAAQLDSARKFAKDAQATLDAVVQAKSLCERELPERQRETQRLREAVSQYEAFEQELKHDFAPASWQSVSGNLTQARALLETFDRKAAEAAQAADGTNQKYLLAARLIGRLGQEQQAVFQLMNAVGEQLAGLKAIRTEAQRLANDLDDRERQVRKYFTQYEHVVGAQAQASLQAATQAKVEARRKSSGSQPDWPSIHQALAKAIEEYSIAQSQAEADVKIFELLTSEYDKARQNANRVQAFLAGHSEDRLAANQHYQHAEEVLNLVGDESTHVGNEWAKLLDQVRGAQADLDYAEQLAREDIRLARQAESELSEATRTIRQARTFFSMGITLNTAGAESLLNQAGQLYHSQNYEQAIRTAAASIQQARLIHNQAAQEVYARQMQVQADQQRRVAAFNNFGMGAAVGAASVLLNQGGSASAASSNFAGPPADSSGTSSSSWSSGTSESTW